jgi:hypothetical protein
MKRNSSRPFGQAFHAWTDLMWKMGEMSLASAQVITHRTTRMAAAGPLPNSRDRQEFSRMGQEKVEAATESALAIAARLTTMSGMVSVRAFGNMINANAALMSLAASRTSGQFFVRQAKLANAVSRSAVTASAWTGSAARLADSGLKPIHARATANARRLRKR